MNPPTPSAPLQFQRLWQRSFPSPIAQLRWAPRHPALAILAADHTFATLEGRSGQPATTLNNPGIRAFTSHPELPSVAVGDCHGLVQIHSANQAHDETPAPRALPVAHRLAVDHLQWSRDRPAHDAQLAVVAGPHLQILNIGYGIEHDWDQPGLHALQWHPVFRMLSTADAAGFKLWMPGQAEHFRQFPVTGAGHCLEWAPNGATLACTSTDDGLILLNPMSGQCRALAGVGQPITQLAWHGQRQFIAATDSQVILRWNLDPGAPCGKIPGLLLEGHHATIRALSFQPAGALLASGGDDCQLLLWAPDSSDTPVLAIPMPAPICALAWAPDGQQLAVALADGGLELLRLSR